MFDVPLWFGLRGDLLNKKLLVLFLAFKLLLESCEFVSLRIRWLLALLRLGFALLCREVALRSVAKNFYWLFWRAVSLLVIYDKISCTS